MREITSRSHGCSNANFLQRLLKLENMLRRTTADRGNNVSQLVVDKSSNTISASGMCSQCVGLAVTTDLNSSVDGSHVRHFFAKALRHLRLPYFWSLSWTCGRMLWVIFAENIDHIRPFSKVTLECWSSSNLKIWSTLVVIVLVNCHPLAVKPHSKLRNLIDWMGLYFVNAACCTFA